MKCPCHSGKEYERCCGPFHEGVLPSNALALMRSRYAAYALGLVDYIIATTHPQNPSWPLRAEDLKAFCVSTKFLGLEIVQFTDGDETAAVTFRASLEQGGQKFSHVEKSLFEKAGGRWLYKDQLPF